MARIKYEEWKPGRDAQRTVQMANTICAEYQRQGLNLTLRQLYYQFVSRDLIANTQREYDKLGAIVARARMAGLLDWEAIVDRTRNVRDLSHWDTPADVIDTAAKLFKTDRWATQPYRCEVWIEKDALVGVLDAVCPEEDVPYFSCRGYTSASEVWGAAQRLGAFIRAGQNVRIIHLGDHDPSGIDMTRDIEDRLKLFIHKDNLTTSMAQVLDEEHHRAKLNYDDNDVLIHDEAFEAASQRVIEVAADYGVIEVNRIALNMDQVEEYNPPPNPAKMTDSRATSYVEQFGYESWELDALEPAVLINLISEAIDEVKDQDAWERATDEQESARQELTAISLNYEWAVEAARQDGD